MTAALAATGVGLLMLAVAWRFHRAQNVSKQIGGEISVPKALWLGYAVGSWFVLPFVFVLSPEVDRALEVVLVCHLVSWWIRGPIELVMIYKTFNWSPIYGISHDLAHVSLLVGVYIANGGATWQASWTNPMSSLAAIYLAVTVLSLFMEMTFAYLFRRARGFEPGAKLIYFASDDPVYRFINRLTLATVIVVYGHFVVQLGWLYWLAIG